MPITSDDVDYAYDFINDVCEQVGPGVPASPQERARADLIHEKLAAAGLEGVTTEEFELAPGAFFGWFRVACVLALAAFGLHFAARYPTNSAGISLLLSGVALVFSALVIVTAVLEFFLYKEFVDGLFPKKKSQNVVGSVASSATPRHLLVVSGHLDSAWAFRWLHYLNFGYYVAMGFIFVGILSLAGVTGGQFVRALVTPGVLAGRGLTVFEIILLVILPLCLVSAFFFVESGKNGGTVPGANDNLSGVAIAAAIGRHLVAHPEVIPADTEVRIVAFGSEEAGCRGSKRYVAAHLTELREKRARVCNIDTIARPKIQIVTTDRNSLLKNAPGVVAELKAAAESAGVPHEVKPFPVFGGGTDALAFGERGLEAAALYAMAVPSQMMEWYHQPGDDIDKVDKEALANALKIVLAWVAAHQPAGASEA